MNTRHSFAIIVAISRDVFRAASKEKLMYGFLLLSLLFVLLANMPFVINNPDLFEGMSAKVASVQIGFIGINIFLLLTSVFIGVTVLQDFFAESNIVLLLSKPIKRWHVLEGICFGMFKIIFLNWLIMVSSLMIIVNFHTLEINAFIWSGMSVSLVLALVYISLLIFFYSFVPNAISGILTIFIIIAGFGVSLTQAQLASLPQPILFFVKTGLEAIPKINLLFGISMNALGIFDIPIKTLPIFLHTIIFLAVLHSISYFRFSRPQ